MMSTIEIKYDGHVGIKPNVSAQVGIRQLRSVLPERLTSITEQKSGNALGNRFNG